MSRDCLGVVVNQLKIFWYCAVWLVTQLWLRVPLETRKCPGNILLPTWCRHVLYIAGSFITFCITMSWPMLMLWKTSALPPCRWCCCSALSSNSWLSISSVSSHAACLHYLLPEKWDASVTDVWSRTDCAMPGHLNSSTFWLAVACILLWCSCVVGP